MNIQLELSWQPIFGGGCRGIGYFDALNLGMKEIHYIFDWIERRYKSESSAFAKRGR